MKPQNKNYEYLHGVSILLAAIAIGWSLGLLAQTPAFLHQADRQQQLIVQLEALEREKNVLDAWIQPFTDSQPAGNLLPHLERIFDSTDPSQRQVDTTFISDRFPLHTVTFELPDVLYTSLVERIKRAESLRPPLKLTVCLLEPAPGKSAEGRASLTFERIEWHQERQSP